MMRFLFALLILALAGNAFGQETVRHFKGVVELSAGMGAIADFTRSHGQHRPLLAYQAGLLTRRELFTDKTYLELGLAAARRGNRSKADSLVPASESMAFPDLQVHYLDLPVRFYWRVGRTPHLSPFLFLGFTASYPFRWNSSLHATQLPEDLRVADELAYSISYGLAVEYLNWRFRLHGNLALKTLVGLSKSDEHYLPYEILLGCAYILN